MRVLPTFPALSEIKHPMYQLPQKPDATSSQSDAFATMGCLDLRAPKARTAKAWGNAPGKGSHSVRALKARDFGPIKKSLAERMCLRSSGRAFSA
jgi:hypothetical protein